MEQLKLPLLHEAEGRQCTDVIALWNVQILYVLLRSDGSVGKESACNAGDPSSTPGSGRSAGEGKGCPLPYSGLENSMEVAKSRTRLSNFHFSLPTMN